MSLSIARSWVRKAIRPDAVQKQALALLDRAHAEGVEATMIVGKNVATSRRCYVARCTRREVIVLELPESLQATFQVIPNGLFQHLPTLTTECAPCEPWVEIREAHIEPVPGDDPKVEWSGTCNYEIRTGDERVLNRCALCAEYFRPDMRRDIKAWWYFDQIYVKPSGQLSFRFPRFESFGNSVGVVGPTILFLQLFTAANWARKQGVQKISNEVGVIADVSKSFGEIA